MLHCDNDFLELGYQDDKGTLTLNRTDCHARRGKAMNSFMLVKIVHTLAGA